MSIIRALLQQQLPSTSSPIHHIIMTSINDTTEECSPFKITGANSSYLRCEYVKDHSDNCEGGGYLSWTQYTICEDDVTTKAFIIVAAVILLLILFLFLSISADDFFCRNIAAIVDHLKIPQHIAGVTFMAFGNGAPDVFTSLASALSTSQPKAGLSIGELLGAGIFVTTMVVAAIVLARPFKVMRRPILRDIVFYLIAIGWITFIIFYDNEVYIWQPAFFLVLYVIYVGTVIFGRKFSQSKKRKERAIRKMERRLTLMEHRLTIVDKLEELKAEELKNRSGRNSMMNSMPSIPHSIHTNGTRPSIPNGASRLSIANGASRLSIPGGNPKGCADELPEKIVLDDTNVVPEKKISLTRSKSDMLIDTSKIDISTNNVGSVTTVPSRRDSQSSINYALLFNPLKLQMTANMLLPSMITPAAVEEEEDDSKPIIEHGKFFPALEEIEDDDSEEDDKSLVYISGAHDVISVQEAKSRATSIASPPPPSKDVSWNGIFHDLMKHLNPVDVDEFKGSNWITKIYLLIKIPIYFILNVSIPVAECSWCKSLALIHCFTSPMTILFAFMFLNTQIISGWPGLWLFSLVLSIILAALIFFFTSFTQEPRFYKPLAAYSGFVLSVAWIYVIANEVVDVVSMIGVMAGVSHELLGLTILAWANSIGDMIADFSVARQGFPRMAISAAIGGPLFNLMIGFGVSFFIAKCQGKTVTTRLAGHHGVDTVKKLMIMFLSASLIITTILMFIQKFNVKRPHAIVLIVLYIAFLVLVILAQTNVLNF